MKRISYRETAYTKVCKERKK